MILFDRAGLDLYLKVDPILPMLNAPSALPYASFVSHRWMVEAPAKRFTFWKTYGDLLSDAGESLSVLDVGGGLSALTERIGRLHRYSLLDLMAHDPRPAVLAAFARLDRATWIEADWYGVDPVPTADLVIANDLFPNVDQRLDLFLMRYLPRCKRLRMTLTFYDSPRFYKVKRTDGDEIFHMLAWTGDDVARILARYAPIVLGYDPGVFGRSGPSLWANGRQVCLVELKGGRDADRP